MYIEIRVQWTINFGSSHMRVHACDTEACDMCYVFNVNLTDSFDDRRSQCRLIEQFEQFIESRKHRTQIMGMRDIVQLYTMVQQIMYA